MSYLSRLVALAGVIAAPAIQAQNYNLSGYRASPGLTAEAAQQTLTITWDGERNDEIRLRLSLRGRLPLRRRKLPWPSLAGISSMDMVHHL